MKWRRGFTLIELLVVIAIIGILGSIVLASLSSARTNAKIVAGKQFDQNIFSGNADYLVGQWNFDEASGPTVLDTSGNGNNGTITGSVTRVAAIKGNGLSFPGTAIGNYVQISGVPVLMVGQPKLTISAWVYPTFAGSGTQQVVGSNGPYLLWIDAANAQVQTGLYQGAWFWTYSGVNTVQANIWQFLVMTYDGTTRKVYVNGVQVGGNDTALSGNIGAFINPIGIGEDVCCGGVRPFAGTIDEVRIYATALTAQAVEKLYAEEAPKHGLAVR